MMKDQVKIWNVDLHPSSCEIVLSKQAAQMNGLMSNWFEYVVRQINFT